MDRKITEREPTPILSLDERRKLQRARALLVFPARVVEPSWWQKFLEMLGRTHGGSCR